MHFLSLSQFPPETQLSYRVERLVSSLLTEKEKHIYISQDKQLANHQSRLNFLYGSLPRTWVGKEAEKEASGSEKESSLAEILSLFDQVILILGQAMNRCSYIRRFNILMAFFDE